MKNTIFLLTHTSIITNQILKCHKVINVGDYNSNCIFTRNKICKVPDNYVIEPIYGELLTTVQCSNKYDKNKPIYKIKWDNKTVESSKTPTDVTLDQLPIQSYIIAINFNKVGESPNQFLIH